MKLMRAAMVLAGLGILGTLAVQPGEAVAQAAPAAQPAKIGSSLIGKLEGPTVILDANAYPKTFKEAPILAEQVKAGKLPAVAKRLPDASQVFVIKPLHEIGRRRADERSRHRLQLFAVPGTQHPFPLRRVTARPYQEVQRGFVP
jgi:hypothetical protein